MGTKRGNDSLLCSEKLQAGIVLAHLKIAIAFLYDSLVVKKLQWQNQT